MIFCSIFTSAPPLVGRSSWNVLYNDLIINHWFCLKYIEHQWPFCEYVLQILYNSQQVFFIRLFKPYSFTEVRYLTNLLNRYSIPLLYKTVTSKSELHILLYTSIARHWFINCLSKSIEIFPRFLQTCTTKSAVSFKPTGCPLVCSFLKCHVHNY